MIKNFLRRLRGAFGNATVWAATWFLAAFPLHVMYWMFGIRSGPFWDSALGMMLSYAGGGFLAGAAFSVYLGIAGRKQRLAELKPGRVGLGSAVTVGVVVPGLLWFLGDPQISAASGMIIASTIGLLAGATALAQVKIAQGALTPGDHVREKLESASEPLLPAPETEVV
jgi:hypothetical protein